MGDIEINTFLTQYKLLIQRENQMRILLDAVLEEASLSFDRQDLVLDINSSRYLFNAVKLLFPDHYKQKLYELQDEEVDEDA